MVDHYKDKGMSDSSVLKGVIRSLPIAGGLLAVGANSVNESCCTTNGCHPTPPIGVGDG